MFNKNYHNFYMSKSYAKESSLTINVFEQREIYLYFFNIM